METPFVTPLLIVPVRKEASDASEMVTQLLFGETGRILSEDRQWRRIRLDADGYEGWVDEKTLVEIDDAWRTKVLHWETVLQDDLLAEVSSPGGAFEMHLPRGARFAVTREAQGSLYMEVGNWRVMIHAEDLTTPSMPLDMDQSCGAFMGAPYLWGGKSRMGIDCSGLTQLCALHAGMQLPRDAWQQAEAGTKVDWANRQPGDLAYFANAQGRITHTGILLEGDRICHAHGYVRVDKCTEEGILNVEKDRITHHLAHVMRIA